jgi:hypothetical protein
VIARQPIRAAAHQSNEKNALTVSETQKSDCALNLRYKSQEQDAMNLQTMPFLLLSSVSGFGFALTGAAPSFVRPLIPFYSLFLFDVMLDSAGDVIRSTTVWGQAGPAAGPAAGPGS